MEYKAALNAFEANSLQQLKTLNLVDLSAIHPVEQKNEASFQPQYSDQHDLLAFIENNEGKYSLVIRSEDEKVLTLKNLPTGQLQSIDFHPIEKKILYSQINNVDINHNYAGFVDFQCSLICNFFLTKKTYYFYISTAHSCIALR